MTKRNQEALKALYKWMIDKASELEDGDTGMNRCMEAFCDESGIPQHVGEWAAGIYNARSAWDAGIPLTVISQKLINDMIDLYVAPEEDSDGGSIAEG